MSDADFGDLPRRPPPLRGVNRSRALHRQLSGNEPTNRPQPPPLPSRVVPSRVEEEEEPPPSSGTWAFAGARRELPSGEHPILRPPVAQDVLARRGGAASPADLLTQIVQTHLDFVWRSLRRLGVPEADCDDGCQRVWIVLARKLDAIESGKERSYIFSVAVRVASEMRRSERARTTRFSSAEVPDAAVAVSEEDPERNLQRQRALELLDQVLAGFSWELRTVFVMFELEGFNSHEIAHALGVSRGTVASRLRLAREGFQRAVQQHETSVARVDGRRIEDLGRGRS